MGRFFAPFCLTFFVWYDIMIIHDRKSQNELGLFVVLAGKINILTYSERSYTWIIRKNFM